VLSTSRISQVDDDAAMKLQLRLLQSPVTVADGDDSFRDDRLSSVTEPRVTCMLEHFQRTPGVARSLCSCRVVFLLHSSTKPLASVSHASALLSICSPKHRKMSPIFFTFCDEGGTHKQWWLDVIRTIVLMTLRTLQLYATATSARSDAYN